MKEVRCPKCNKLLGKFSGEYEVKCPRCKEIVKQEHQKKGECQRVRIKTGDSVIIKMRQSNGGVKEIHGEVVGVGKYYSRFLGDKEPQYSVRTNEKSSYLGLHYVVDADEIKLSKEPFIYDTAAEDEFQKNNPSMCHILGVVTKYNTHLFLNTD